MMSIEDPIQQSLPAQQTVDAIMALADEDGQDIWAARLRGLLKAALPPLFALRDQGRITPGSMDELCEQLGLRNLSELAFGGRPGVGDDLLAPLRRSLEQVPFFKAGEEPLHTGALREHGHLLIMPGRMRGALAQPA